MTMPDSLLLTDIPPQAESLLHDRNYTIIMAKTLHSPVAPPPGFAERWFTAQASISDLAQKCEEFNPNGITLYVARQAAESVCAFQRHDHVNSDTLTSLVEGSMPPQSVQLASGLQAALDDYFTRKAQGIAPTNGQIILVLLDGEPTDRMAIANTIVKATHRIDRSEEIGIGFIQITEDPIAKGFFDMLDDHLKDAGAKYDIVDTQILSTITKDSLSTFLLNTLFD